MRIHKFKLEMVESGMIYAPKEAKPLTVQVQGEDVCLWMMVDAYYPETAYEYQVFDTGHHIPGEYQGEYVGTVQKMEGQLIWHIFLRELPNDPQD